MIAVSRSLMPAPPGASFLRHGPPHHHFSICCPFVKILSALHNFGHSYHPAICQNSFSSFGHWELGSCRIHPLPPRAWLWRVCFCSGLEKWANYWWSVWLLFSQMGVVPTQITCNAPRSKTMGTSCTIHQIYNPHILRRKKFSSVIMPVCFLPRREPLLWSLYSK